MEMVSDSFVSNPTATDLSRFATILKKTWKRVTSLTRRMKTLLIAVHGKILPRNSQALPVKKLIGKILPSTASNKCFHASG